MNRLFLSVPFCLILILGVLPLGSIPAQGAIELSPQEKLITLLGTNDIHGGVESRVSRDGKRQGGLDFWAGAIRSIREGIRKQFGDERAGVWVLDGGDQFQGTLLSNFDEGRLVMQSLSEAGLDAAVPGNHDYDFGPLGWLTDQLPRDTAPGLSPESDPRGALKAAIEGVRFPLLSANTYIKTSLRNWDGVPLEVESKNCAPKTPGADPVFIQAERPSFLKPYIISEKAGLRVALIGLDHVATASMTTAQNVSDLCFRNEIDTYLEIRDELEGQADVFVLLVHGGNTPQNPELSHWIEKLLESRPGKTDTLHAVIGGHTHQVHRDWVRGVPIIQSGSGGELFGRIDLVWNTTTHAIDIARTQALAGIRLLHQGCPAGTEFQCKVGEDQKSPFLEGIQVEPSASIRDKIQTASRALAPLADQLLGTAEKTLFRDRINESPLANSLNDIFLDVTQADVTLLNTGGIRDQVAEGPIHYASFFRVLPFNNRAVLIRDFEVARLMSLLEKSIKTCGDYGALMPGGLRVEFFRQCGNSAGKTDPDAYLIQVRLAQSDEVLFDRNHGGLLVPGRTLKLATLDFLAAGGSAYPEFIGAPEGEDLGIFRETLVGLLKARAPVFKGTVDGRWLNRGN